MDVFARLLFELSGDMKDDSPMRSSPSFSLQRYSWVSSAATKDTAHACYLPPKALVNVYLVFPDTAGSAAPMRPFMRTRCCRLLSFPFLTSGVAFSHCSSRISRGSTNVRRVASYTLLIGAGLAPVAVTQIGQRVAVLADCPSSSGRSHRLAH